MRNIAFVFAGQGAQYPGMGKDIYNSSEAAAKVFDMTDSLRPGTSKQCFAGTPEELALTKNTQPCLFAVDLAIAAALKEIGIQPKGVAGFSLGEIPALTFAGAFTEDDGFRLVIKRAEAMNEAAENSDGCMAAVLKLKAQEVEALCKDYKNIWAVNFNSPGQTVVAGDKESIKAFSLKVKEAKGLAMPLKVSGAFHSPYMAEASKEVERFLTHITYQKPLLDVYANLNAEIYPEQEEAGKALIAAQIKSPVQWQKIVEQMLEAGFDTFVEVGPGKTLGGLIKKISPEAVVYKVENTEDLKLVAEALL